MTAAATRNATPPRGDRAPSVALCGARLDERVLLECQLDAGHDGDHEDRVEHLSSSPVPHRPYVVRWGGP